MHEPRPARSSVAVTIASSHAGPRARTSPLGPHTVDMPGNTLPPSLPARLESTANTPCSSASSRMSRSHRLELAGPGTPSPRGHAPRAGAALHTNITWAPVQRRDRRGHAVPGVLADQDRRTSPRGIKCSDLAAPLLDEPLFVEQAVRWAERSCGGHAGSGWRRCPESHTGALL